MVRLPSGTFVEERYVVTASWTGEAFCVIFVTDEERCLSQKDGQFLEAVLQSVVNRQNQRIGELTLENPNN